MPSHRILDPDNNDGRGDFNKQLELRELPNFASCEGRRNRLLNIDLLLSIIVLCKTSKKSAKGR